MIDIQSSKQSLYQSQYSKNLQLIYKKCFSFVPISLTLTVESWVHLFQCFIQESKDFYCKIKAFLTFLSIYEVNTGKTHKKYCENDWDDFFSYFPSLSLEDINNLKENVFKKNIKHYPWSTEEDMLLIKIINQKSKEYKKSSQIRSIRWKEVAKEFNSDISVAQFRTPHICKERWKNNLQTRYKKSQWSNQEDLFILDFVTKNGSKWSKIALLLKNRTEHCIKNRFFSILSMFIRIPQRKMKKEINYLDQNFLNSIRTQYKMFKKADENKDENSKTSSKNEQTYEQTQTSSENSNFCLEGGIRKSSITSSESEIFSWISF